MLPFGSVAVAVTTPLAAGNGTENAAWPDPSVVTSEEPRNVFPSPLPDGLHEGLAEKST